MCAPCSRHAIPHRKLGIGVAGNIGDGKVVDHEGIDQYQKCASHRHKQQPGANKREDAIMRASPRATPHSGYTDSSSATPSARHSSPLPISGIMMLGPYKHSPGDGDWLPSLSQLLAACSFHHVSPALLSRGYDCLFFQFALHHNALPFTEQIRQKCLRKRHLLNLQRRKW